MTAPSPYGRVMATSTSVARAASALDRIIGSVADENELLAAVDAEVARLVPSDGSFWVGLDPATLLCTAPSRLENVSSEYCSEFWRLEFLEQDTNLMRDLARRRVPVATLHQVTEDLPARSPRWRDFLDPQGYDDELRAVLRTGGTSWGFLSLFRERGRAAFTEQEVQIIASVGEVIARGLRTYVTRKLPTGTARPSGPGMLILDATSTPVSGNAEVLDWLQEMRISSATPPYDARSRQILETLAGRALPDDAGLPTAVLAVAARARAVRDGRESGPARLRVRSRDGRWLIVHASCLGGDDAPDLVGIVVEAALGSEIAPIIIEAYGLSPRERDVTRDLAQGMGTQEIAESLCLSPHTVRDYVKSVFEKVGVCSRGELIAKVFADHYSDGVHSGTVHLG